MKKVISFLMAIVMLVSLSAGLDMTAFAAVRYDTAKAKDTATYKMLNITGTNHYDYAFSVLNEINSKRRANGAENLKMSKELLDAAMLRSHELSVVYGLDRPNGEVFDYVVDGKGVTIFYEMVILSNKGNFAKDVVNKWYDADKDQYMISPEMKSAGVGCMELNGYCYWVLFYSADNCSDTVAKSKYSNTVSKTEKIALHKQYWSEWNKVHKHTYSISSTTPADASNKKNGKITRKCKVCSHTTSSAIQYPKTVTLSATSYVYNGKVKKPGVTVKDAKGNKISSSYYTVSYSSGRKNVGRYTVTVKFKGNYKGTIKKTFDIKPKATTLSTITSLKKGFTVKWKKMTTQTTGYQVQYSTASNFKGAKTITVTKNKNYAKKVTKLKAKKRYYVRIRTYKTVKYNGKNIKLYSSWSKAKSVVTKK